MVLIAVGLALLVNQLASGLPRIRSADWLARWLHLISATLHRVPGMGGTAGFLLMLLPPVLVVGGLQHWLRLEGLVVVEFALASLVLVYSWGPRNLDEDVDQIVGADDGESARMRAEAMLGGDLPKSEDEWTWESTRAVFRESVYRWFGVLFWFLVLGPAGALLFRLSHRAAQCDAELSGSQHSAACRLTAILNMPAALLTACGIAVVSDFDAIMGTLRRHFRRHDLMPALLSTGFVEEVGEAAVSRRLAGEDALESDVLGPRRRVALAMSMTWRTLVTWLAVLAVAVIAGLIA